MPSRQDQLHSYQFMTQRVVAALVMRETDPAQSPFRRIASATMAGALFAALGLAGAAVYGALRGASAEGWRDNGTVIIERESGAKYIYRDGTLHPVLNYASALLIVGSASPKIVTVSRGALAGAHRGTTYGIPKAPDALPDPGRLQRPPWTVCTVPDPGNRGTRLAVLSLQSRRDVGRPLDESSGMLVSAPGDEIYLIWRNQRYQIRDRDVVLAALGGSRQPRVPISAALRNTLTTGADISRIHLPATRGSPSTATKNGRVGQVFVIVNEGKAVQYAVALPAGLAPITQLQADILLGDPDSASLVNQTVAISMPPAEYNTIPKVPLALSRGDTAPPESAPKLVSLAPETVVCTLIRGGGAASELRVDVPAPDLTGATTTGVRAPEGTPLADRVVIPPGSGAVVESISSPTDTNGALSIITDLGIRYPVARPEVLAMLGYAGVTPVKVPSEVVSLLPTGPALDPAAALQPAT
jgi:type VII secretion protein EccB